MKKNITATNQNDSFEKFRVQSIDRTFTIVDVISAHMPHGLSLTEIATETGLHISTVYRLIQNLLHWQYVREGLEGHYQLGWQFLHLGSKIQNNTSLIATATPHLSTLGNATGQTVYLATLADGGKHILYLHKVKSQGAIQLSSDIGTKNSVYSTAAGKALLSDWSSDRVFEMLKKITMVPFTPNTITSPERFLLEVKKACNLGYALSLEENENSVSCVAAPILDHTGHVAAAVCLSGVYTANDFALIQNRYIPLVVETARQISVQLGYEKKI